MPTPEPDLTSQAFVNAFIPKENRVVTQDEILAAIRELQESMLTTQQALQNHSERLTVLEP